MKVIEEFQALVQQMSSKQMISSSLLNKSSNLEDILTKTLQQHARINEELTKEYQRLRQSTILPNR